MALGAEYEQSARLYDLLLFGIGHDALFRLYFLESCACGKNIRVVGASEFGRFEYMLLGKSLGTHLRFCKIFAVSSEHYIGSASRHVGGNGNGAVFARLGDYLRFLLVIFGVKDAVGYSVALENIRKYFAFFYRWGTDKHRLTL